MAAWPFLQAREHTPHGNLAGRGPGLDSRSPESIRREHSQEEGGAGLDVQNQTLGKMVAPGGNSGVGGRQQNAGHGEGEEG